MPKPIPFVGVPRGRSTGTSDERFINVLFEEVQNPLLREHTIQCVKRQGLSNFSQPSGATATGRGVYGWGANGKLYSVCGNRIYSNTTAIGVTLAGSSGMCRFVETPASTSKQVLIVSDGTDNYTIDTSDTITQIDESDSSFYPTPNLVTIDYIDGYLLQGKSNGQLWNSNLNSWTAWGSSSYISIDTHGGALVAQHVQKDQVICFTKNRLEFLFNNGNPIGSPFKRIDQNTILVGCPAQQSIAFSGEILIFVSENSAEGDTRSVHMISSLKNVTDIGLNNPLLQRVLNAETTNISTCTSFMMKAGGHLLYVLNLTSANRTFVFQVDKGMWAEWTSSSGGRFGCVAATALDGVLYLQDATNGRIYTSSPTDYQDSGSNFTVTLQTGRSNFGAPQLRKSEDSLSIMGDTTTGNLQVSVSDDDFGNFGNARSIDMSKKDKRIYRVGQRFFERAHKFTYTDNYALRLQAWVPDISI